MNKARAIVVAATLAAAWGCSAGNTVDSGNGGSPSSSSSSSDGGQGGSMVGSGGAGPCTDNCPCTPGAAESCYSGPDGTEGVGICKAGTHECFEDGEFGKWGPCVGETLPTVPEVCDEAALDDDCDGVANEGCPTCTEGDLQPCGQPGWCDYKLCVGGQFGPCGGTTVVLDESFENATPGEGIQPPTLVGAWTVMAGDIDVVHSPNGLLGPSHTGAQGIDLNGWNPGTISASLATAAGKRYVLRFAYTKNPSPVVTMPAGANVAINGNVVLNLIAAQMNSYTNLMWECKGVAFTAQGTSTTLVINSTTSTPANGGVYLDSFRVTEP